jgi:hypothetical protein
MGLLLALLSLLLMGCQKANRYPDPIFETYLSPFELDKLNGKAIRMVGKSEYLDKLPSAPSTRPDVYYDYDIYYHPNEQVYMDYHWFHETQTETHDFWITEGESVTERKCLNRFCDYATRSGDSQEVFDNFTKPTMSQSYFVLPSYGEIEHSDSVASVYVSLSDFFKYETAFIDRFLHAKEPYYGEILKEEYAPASSNVYIFLRKLDDASVQYSILSDQYAYNDRYVTHFEYTLLIRLEDNRTPFETSHRLSYSVGAYESIDDVDYVYPNQSIDIQVSLPQVENNYLAFYLSKGEYEVLIRNSSADATYQGLWYDPSMNPVDVTNIEANGVYYLQIICLNGSQKYVNIKINPVGS